MEAGLARLARQPGKRDEFLLCLYEKISGVDKRRTDGGRRTTDGGRRTTDGVRRTTDGGRRTADGGPRSIL